MENHYQPRGFVSPGAGRLTPIRYGNPGKDCGLRPLTVRVGNWVGTGIFHVIEATDGTWLSSATRKFGWGAAYGPKDGYGAYVEGIVRRSDGSPIFGKDADDIEPGEQFYIAIYEGGAEGATANREKLELVDSEKDRIDIKGPSVELAEALGIGQELLGQLIEPLGVAFAWIQVPMQMADLGKGPFPPLAAARAYCYAKTAFAWMEDGHGPFPVSSVFYYLRDNPIIRYQELFPVVQKAWNDSWIETISQLTTQFEKARVEIYMEVSRRGGNTRPLNVPALRRLAKETMQNAYGTAPDYCAHCLKEVGEASWWKNRFSGIVKPVWDMQAKTPYPK